MISHACLFCIWHAYFVSVFMDSVSPQRCLVSAVWLVSSIDQQTSKMSTQHSPSKCKWPRWSHALLDDFMLQTHPSQHVNLVNILLLRGQVPSLRMLSLDWQGVACQ